MDEKAFQDYYPDELAHCYGCGLQGRRAGHGHLASLALCHRFASRG